MSTTPSAAHVPPSSLPPATTQPILSTSTSGSSSINTSTVPVTLTPTAPAPTEQHFSPGVTMSPQLSSRLTMPSTSLGSFRLFNMSEPFSWTPTMPSIQRPTVSVRPAAPLPTHYSGPMFTGQPGVMPFESSSTYEHTATPVTTSTLSQLSSQLTFSTPNVTNIVTTRLDKVEDYLPWRTQFESFLVSHGLLGIIDGSILAPPQTIFDAPNPEYHSWLKIDQTVRSWLFATLSRNILLEVHTLHFSTLTWEWLETRFMAACVARSIELKRILSSLKKKDDQSMDDYLREIIVLTDSLNSINSPISNRELLQQTVAGLGHEYESVITSVTLFPDSFTFESLRPQLMALEQRALYLRTQNAHPGHQAFVAHEQQPAVRPPGRGGSAARGNGGRGFRGGGRARGHRGRGRGYGGQHGYGYGGQQGGYDQQPACGHPPLAPVPGPYGWQQGAPPRAPQQAGFPGFPSVEHNYPSPAPLVVCQLCYSPGHSAINCPRFTNSTPALAAIPTGETNASVWYPDSGASAHMTPHEGQSHGSHTSPGLQ
ncbi:unnamed protein product [Cuscuta epithymum]|uniref:Retrotransposon gag domain-containing protein n=1 Tax=Cuscuta epithymum TaxID=186058 RepID=A0AAV0BW98_9ASTE|nr:unnamed protein product [Cuscuta epithymum]